LEDGKKYKGEWLANSKNLVDGVGVMILADGTHYEG